MKLLLLCVAILTSAFGAGASDTRSMQEHQIEMWDRYVAAQVKVGAYQEALEKVLLPKSVDQLTTVLGGTGHYIRYYAIDDFIMIRASFDPSKKLMSVPKAIPRMKWRRYPDGTGHPEPTEVSPDGALVYP